MKLAVINFSGNVGKSTVARHLLAPRIPGSTLIAVESGNDSGGKQQTIRGREFALLQEYLQTTSDVVVDIGASNVEDFLAMMCHYKGSHADFDGFVVPTVPARKQQQDTAATLSELARMGVPQERVRLVFNQLERHDAIEQVFETLLAYCAATGTAQPRLAACLRLNDIYSRARFSDKSLIELANDSVDYKAEIAKAGSTAEKLALAHQLGTHRLACGVVPELDACFAALELEGLTQAPVRVAVPA